ncbi:MAG: GNAT family N-acetyltransferase [Pseudomonadota bacterium]
MEEEALQPEAAAMFRLRRGDDATPGVAEALAHYLATKRNALAPALGPREARPAVMRAAAPAQAAAMMRPAGPDGDHGWEVAGAIAYRFQGVSAYAASTAALCRRHGPVGGAWRSLLARAMQARGRAGWLTIEAFSVERAWRGRGFGTALLSWTVREAARLGTRGWRAEAPGSSVAARKLYARAGAVEAGEVALGPLRPLLQLPVLIRIEAPFDGDKRSPAPYLQGVLAEDRHTGSRP